jgi:deoxyribonuclease V
MRGPVGFRLRHGFHTRRALACSRATLWLHTRAGMRPIAVHAAWRTDPATATATAIVLSVLGGHRTPEPLRQARQLARLARAQDALP